MATDVQVAGPMQVISDVTIGDDVVPLTRLGHTADGLSFSMQKEWDDIQTDDIGPDVLRDRVFTGEKVFLDFELHSLTRSVFDVLAWLGATAGTKTQIGRRMDQLDGTDEKSLKVTFSSEASGGDIYNFWNVCPIRVVQRFGNKHTTVTVRAEAIIGKDANADSFFDNTTVEGALTGADSPEVQGGHTILHGPTALVLGITREGCEMTIDYSYDDVAIDTKGSGTNFTKVMTGQRVSLVTELHSYDPTEMETILANGGGTYGSLANIGKLASSTFGTQLQLDNSRGTAGFDWNFKACVLEGQQTLNISARHSVLNLTWQCLPVTGAGVFFSFAAGEAGTVT